MIYLILSILSSALLFTIFEWVNLKKIALLPTIVINYAVCSLCGHILLKTPFIFKTFTFHWEYITMLGMGFLFISTFFLMGKSTAVLGGSKSSVASKMSVVLPILISVIFLKQHIITVQIIGIGIGLISVYFTSKTSTLSSNNQKNASLLILVFLGSGLVDSGLNVLSYFFASTHANYPYFVSTYIFSSAFIAGSTLSMSIPKFRKQFNLKNSLSGIILGLVNFSSLVFVFKALAFFKNQQAYYWMVNNIGVLLLSSLISILIFKRKLQNINYIGLALSILAIILLNIS